jgi:hypothetical protein
MSLRTDAIELSVALNQVLAGLLAYDLGRNVYATELAKRLGPRVETYDHAVFVRPSRADAADAISALADCMATVSSASTKGEMDFGVSNAINKYWNLYTIFRESKYREESL